MSKSLRFILVGTGHQFIASAELLRLRRHDIIGVVSQCPDVSAWAAERGVKRIAVPRPNEWPVGETFDYLLSIVNHTVLPAQLLAAPARGAINYHDSLLPSYGGFNATAWAILDGNAQHGITWHKMTSEVDGGPILIQAAIDVSDDDTAFSLAVKCREAGIVSFETLLHDLENNSLAPRPQAGRRSFHNRSERPGVALLDFRRPATELHAMVRALDFGPDDNWMATPKLGLPDGVVAVLETRVELSRGDSPGMVLSIDKHEIVIAAGTGALAITRVATLDGDPIDCATAAARFGAFVGQLVQIDQTTRTSADDLDALVTKAERFWVERLSSLQAAMLPGIAAHNEHVREVVMRRPWPAALAAKPDDQRIGTIAAALAATLHRLVGGEVLDFASTTDVNSALHSYFAAAAPLRCVVDPTLSFDDVAASMSAEIANHATKQTFAKDAPLRYRSLRSRSRSARAMPIGIDYRAQHDAALTLVEGSHFSLVAVAAAGYAWVYDAAAISATAAQALAARVEALLDGGLADGGTLVGALPVLLPDEQTLVLGTWQQTTLPYESDRCIHEFVERQVMRTPGATAVRFGSCILTYAQLNQRANQLAHVLRDAGVGPETLVGICVERSIEMVVGLLGILKAGGAYVPMDPAYPRERLSLMLEDSKTQFLVTHSHLVARLPATGARVVLVDTLPAPGAADLENPASGVTSQNLAYVIFTSGSTGRPKGTMLEHHNVANFFTGMDATVGVSGATPGVWLAVTSISFDISVLELFWTLARGFEVVIASESDRASLERRQAPAPVAYKPMGFGLFYFSADSGSAVPGAAYQLLIEGAKFADTHGFVAIWTPERHFHAFGGLYPNAAITTAAISTITKRISLRAGSVVLPLHNPLRVAEDWAMIDQLSGGRIGLSFASGWHVNDFALMPENYARRREVMLEHIETVTKLWRGEKVTVRNGNGDPVDVSVLPRPVQVNPPIWIASAGSPETFALAGRLGANVLTNMLGQDLADLKIKFEAYRTARREHGHEGDGIISVMLHTFVCGDSDEAKHLARKPFSDYLASSFDLVKVAPKMFPAFKQPSKGDGHSEAFDASAFTPEDMHALLEHAFDRYFDTAGLFGTPERALDMVDRLMEIGATELACLIDFGIDPDVVLANLPHLHRLQEMCRERVVRTTAASWREERVVDSIATLIRRHHVTHLQCTPSMARVLADDPESLQSLATLDRLLVGGEALPPDLAGRLASVLAGKVKNMYGPTETTVWSTTWDVTPGTPTTIGRPIANTSIRILDQQQQLVPIGVPGELYIGGAGVARGYLDRPELTAERFVPDRWTPGARLYRTGDLVRYLPSGELEFLGRLDHQVKVNGHRIELGEVESALGGHPLIRQSVVVAHTATGSHGHQTLVAYVVTAKDGAATTHTARISGWRGVWDEAYRQGDRAASGDDPRFRIVGWNDSYSGEPIPAPRMLEWVNHTVDRITALRPRRVLEIGCGTGLILYRVLGQVEHYTGVDVSPVALGSIRTELTAAESLRVTLLNLAAHELDRLADRSFDLVVINSVAQYFPDADYMVRVLQRAVDLVADGGHIFVGDVRSLAHLTAFHASVALHQAPPNTTLAELRSTVEQRLAKESELVVSEAFFHALARDTPRLSSVAVQLKRGRVHDELSRFRYDVVLRVGGPDDAPMVVPEPELVTSLEGVRARLAAGAALVRFVNVPNARLSGITGVLRSLTDPSQAPLSVEPLRSALETVSGIDPETLYSLDPNYDVDVRWAMSGGLAEFDAVFGAKHSDGVARQLGDPPEHTRPPAAYANVPGLANDETTLLQQVRGHLAAVLPDYMVPSVFVVMTELPLTPNGKIDRKALPDPQRQSDRHATPYAPPTNTLEQQIGGIWQQLLSVERVGRLDNIFDLGANSLLTMQANSRLATLLQRKVSLVSMFRYPTIASLAAHLDEAGRAMAEALDTQRAQERHSRTEQATQRRRALRAERTVG